MKFFRLSLIIFAILSFSRFIPHPPNFTSLIALSFYVPAIFGVRYISIVILSFAITDLYFGFRSTILFTWGSVILIGLISNYFNVSILKRVFGSLTGAFLFFLLSNFGVWVSGYYGLTLEGLIECYIMAIPFFGYTLISTIFFSVIFETIIFFKRKFILTNL